MSAGSSSFLLRVAPALLAGFVAQSCLDEPNRAKLDDPSAGGTPSGAGGTHQGSAGEAGDPSQDGGAAGVSSGESPEIAGGANAGGAPDAPHGGAGAGGESSGVSSLGDAVERGAATLSQTARPAYGAIVAAGAGARVYVVESRRDVEAGPFGLPWRSRFRVAAYDGDEEAWAFDADPDDRIGDVVVHDSGDITVSVERHPPESDAFDLVRLTSAGEVLGTTTLASPVTIPESDYHADDPQPLFRMKASVGEALTAGWVRLLADGEGVVVAFRSHVAVPPDDPRASLQALGLLTLDFQEDTYVEQWARVVEGPHGADPAAWAYDELRWREQAIRPFLARDEASGDFLVGRAWNNTRCEANLRTFAEFPPEECVLGAVGPAENERLPLAVTRFDSSGARLGTSILRPDEDAAEQLPFALAARDGELAVVGAVVRKDSLGKRKTYGGANGFVDYDGYVSVHDAEGARLRHHDYDLGRGDALVGMRWTDEGIVAAGASGWDRWLGGMSISRGASPLFVWLSQDGTDARQRVIPLGGASRHFNLHDVTVFGQSVVGYGLSDAPMTHSADGGNTAAKTFGLLRVRLASN